jgi:hypothetical protein
MGSAAIVVAGYGTLRSAFDRGGELQFVGDNLKVAGIPARPRVIVEIGPEGPRPLVSSIGEIAHEIPPRAVSPMVTALVAAVRTWIDGPGTDSLMVESVRAQLRSTAARIERLRKGAEFLGVATDDATQEFHDLRWAWLLAEYARRVLDDPAAVTRAVNLSFGWRGTEDELVAAVTDDHSVGGA